ncbi:hypothetical protein LCGC14_0350130 [marine sediment metagenome]|uniref:Uncharacterized protein n=1 Tax=marine sediment metagenome TaxID=412755 RepID=A0A0F9VYH5_9ZZZZ
MAKKGLYKKYIVTKTSGKPIPPEAQFIVLRVDAGQYVGACRTGVAAFAKAVEPLNHNLSWDIQMLLLGLVAKDIREGGE